MSSEAKTKLVVVGAGPGGYAAAFRAADLGMEVTLVDPLINPGGVCLYWGCIPTKALLHVVKVKDEARAAREWGLDFEDPTVDIKKLRAFKDGVTEKLTRGLGQLVKKRKITYIQGRARFEDSNTLEITLTEGETETVSFDNAIIATGSSPVPLPNVDIESERVMYARAALELEEVPESLLVVGGGYIGLELGSVYAKLGTKVTIVEMTDELLPGADRDLVRIFEKANGDLFEQVRLGTQIDAMKEKDDAIEVAFKATNGDSADTSDSQRFEKVLLTVGHRPNVESLGLEGLGVESDGKGFVVVDSQRRTSVNHLYAVGDVAGPPLLAHKAKREGRVAAEAIAGQPSVFEPQSIPSVEYTDPEIAWCGLTEAEASRQGLDVAVSTFPWAASGRAATMGTDIGKTKLIIDKESERILGVGIVGNGAGELIAEGMVALELAALASDMERIIHPHPTLSESFAEAAAAFYGSPTDIVGRA